MEKRSQYPSDSPFNDGLGGEDALANSRELHASPCTRLFLSFILFWLAPVLLGLFNSAHPIIRSVEGTSSRLFLLPGTAVGRTDRRPAHWLSCCYVLRVCERRGGVPAAPSLGTGRRVRDPTGTREGGSFTAKRQSLMSSAVNEESLGGQGRVGGRLLVFDSRTRRFSLLKIKHLQVKNCQNPNKTINN